MSAADGGGGSAAREIAESEAAELLNGSKRVHLRVVGAPAADPQHIEPTQPHRYWYTRSTSQSIKRLSKRELERGRMMYPEGETTYARPKTRGDCLHGEHAQRPCPFVSCKKHLFLDVNEETGSIKVNFPPEDDSPEALVRTLRAMHDTCALDVADRGGATLEEIARAMNLTRERVRQLEGKMLAKLRALADIGRFDDWCDVDRFMRKRAQRRLTGEGFFDKEPADEHGVAGDVSGIVASHDHGPDLFHDGALCSLGF